MEIWKILGFPKMFFSFGDQDGGAGDQGTGNAGDGDGNAGDGASGDDGQATEFVDIGEVKVPKEALEKYAKETFKDEFDSHANKDKWQAKLTQEAMSNSTNKRKAADYDRLVASQQQGQPIDLKTNFLNQVRSQFPDVDPRFVELFAGFIDQSAGAASKKSLNPVLNHLQNQQERDFMDRHKDVAQGSSEANRIADMHDAGYDYETAYNEVMGWANPERRKVLLEKEVNEAIKRRDEENRLKLKRQRQGGGAAGKKKPADSFDETFEEVYAEATSGE